ncbi:MAG: aspartate dehydrogenase [Candidatus Omnitrophica bacterium]|nr:aspartate dehydrogenase [Candidatus Omnitrophota bacterium]
MKQPLLKIGIVGCGAIGKTIIEYCKTDLSDRVKLAGIYDLNKARATAGSLDELIDSSDLVIEAAAQDAAVEVLEKSIKAKKDVMIMSTGGILRRQDLLDSARENNCRIYFPSGAICGLDGVKAAVLRGVDSVTLTTRKPPQGLKGAPYVEERGIDLDSIKDERLIFEGTASLAAKGFPKNINVAAALSLAGIGAEKTMVRIVCVPGSKRNIHEIELKGESGRVSIITENLPFPENPKTSFLAALSAMATLRGIVDNVRIGT